MKHNTQGLARPCRSEDLFLVKEGMQCGNCLAVEESPNATTALSNYARERIYTGHNNSRVCVCDVCWPLHKERLP